MSPQPWRRAAVAALAASALVGGLAVAAPTALAQPADSSSSTEQTQAPISPDQVLMMISQEYQTGKGGGQVSKLIEQVMTLRMRGIRPSRGNAVALSAALEKRPNQVPLIQALEETLTYQRKQMMRSQNQVPSGGGAPPVATPGIPNGPAWQPGNPMQQDSDTIFPMPGR
ncbi:MULTISPECIES: hypothetical protein [Mycolicibacterium]|jgi:hypothetical protein|uniref:DUF732 domain-containing protein n=1 Tax=Mycolicibacterium poriferae TaxID=39694 RepID=A0A6N4VC37_9MYCO|nr:MULTISPECIES: hypothetical protein [Mycolicibacterium]MCG7580189.1 hypothetical protein [Mycolicibacterium sp. OfavD-34-C]MCV7266483.1 hypothetical protein [Mycolicibacterium poriferae]BBX52184.1 hypothetical protein MPOR_32100 [Mycolicibacterium poriferae]